jgi:predicted phosphohydrolase
MAVFAISDLHLSLGGDKPMDIFGGVWENHAQKLADRWRDVAEEDIVLIPGDISWAMSLEEAGPDLAFIEGLPGKKILSKGNHDYWWSTKKKFDDFAALKGFKSIRMLNNNAYREGEFTICGSRCWKPLDDPDFSMDDRKVYNRELSRLRLSLEEGVKLGGELIAMLHYPPFDSSHRQNDFSLLLKEYGVKTCVYGHIHGKTDPSYRNEVLDGLRYCLISADILAFEPVRIA